MPDELQAFAALSSEASFDRVVFDGGEFGHEGEVAVGSDEEMDFLGIPGLLEPDQVRDLLKHRQTERMKEQKRESRRTPREPSAHERLAGLRKELNSLVAAWHHRSGNPHGVIHAELRRTCGGPPAAVATADELTERIDTLREWAARRRPLARPHWRVAVRASEAVDRAAGSGADGALRAQSDEAPCLNQTATRTASGAPMQRAGIRTLVRFGQGSGRRRAPGSRGS